MATDPKERYLKSIDKSLKGIEKSLEKIATSYQEEDDAEGTAGSSGLTQSDIQALLRDEQSYREG